MFIKFLLLIGIVAICFIQCKKEEAEDLSQYQKLYCSAKTNNMDSIKSKIAGTYEWIFSRFWALGNDPVIWTPLNKGYTIKYVFDNNANVKLFRNDSLQWDNTYVVDYEFKVSTYPLDSATMIIIFDKLTGKRVQYFRPYLCNDSARFFNPYSSIDFLANYRRR